VQRISTNVIYSIMCVNAIVSNSYYTCCYVSACLETNVTRLVYTSTYNVVYGGEEIINGDESLPYLPEDKVTIRQISFIKIIRVINFPKRQCDCYNICFNIITTIHFHFLFDVTGEMLVKSLVMNDSSRQVHE
jgi:hypothetical protein